MQPLDENAVAAACDDGRGMKRAKTPGGRADILCEMPQSTGKGAGSLWLEAGRLREELESAQNAVLSARAENVKALKALTGERDELLAAAASKAAELAAAAEAQAASEAARAAAEATLAEAQAEAEAARAAARAQAAAQAAAVATLSQQLAESQAAAAAAVAELARVRGACGALSGAAPLGTRRSRSTHAPTAAWSEFSAAVAPQ